MKELALMCTTLLLSIGFLGNVMGQVTSDDAWINEFHYDNDGADEGEFVEIVIENASSYTLSDFTLTLYNGSNGESYGSETLDSFTEGETIGDFTFYHKEISGIQNGAPDGFSLDYQSTLIQFISYEGSFTGSGGVADGKTSVDVGVEETTSSPIGESLQLKGSGYVYDDFSWNEPSEDSPGEVNDGQFLYPTVQFSNANATANEADGTINIEIKILNPDDNAVDVDVVFQQNISNAEGTDFTSSTTQTISFGSEATDGETKNASFTLKDDSDYEGSETAEFILTNISTSGAAEIDGQTDFTLTIEDDETPNVVINEINADPGGDADGDGDVSTDDDEFVEIVNGESISIDISDWTISDQDNVTHTFDSGTILPAGGAAIVFGSTGFDGSFGGSIVQGTSSVSLLNGGDTVTLKDASGATIDEHTYGSEGGDDQSVVRDPDITGDFVKHTDAEGSGGALFSPGTKTNGSLFTTSLVIEGNTGWRMLSAPVENMSISELTDDNRIQGFGDGFDKNLYTGYDGTSFTAPGDTTDYEFVSGSGFILYFYNNNDAESSTLPIVIDINSGSEPSSDVNVSLHNDGDGWNLLGNPFQTAFDVSSIVVNDGSLSGSTGQIWSDEDESYILTSANDDKVAPGQGFFIQNSDASSVDLPTSGKTTGIRFYKENIQKAYVQLALISEGANGEGEQKDLSTMLYFHEQAKAEWDTWDTEKLYPLKGSYSLLNIVSEDNSKVKAQDSRPFDHLDDEVFYLDVEASNVKPNQVLKWESSSGIPEDWSFTIKDNKTGDEFILDENFSYSFTQDEISKSERIESEKLAKSLTVDEEIESPRLTIILSKGEVTNNEPGNTPEAFTLEQNYPNPFNPTTSIQYSVAKAGEVELTIFNVMGQQVETLVSENKSAGSYRVSWNAANMASGIYYYRLQAGNEVITRQMTLIK